METSRGLASSPATTLSRGLQLVCLLARSLACLLADLLVGSVLSYSYSPIPNISRYDIRVTRILTTPIPQRHHFSLHLLVFQYFYRVKSLIPKLTVRSFTSLSFYLPYRASYLRVESSRRVLESFASFLWDTHTWLMGHTGTLKGVRDREKNALNDELENFIKPTVSKTRVFWLAYLYRCQALRELKRRHG